MNFTTQPTLPPFAGCYTRDYFIHNDNAYINYALLATSYVILTILSVPLNVMVIVAMFKLKRHRNVSDMLIILLSITDLGSGALVCPLYAVLHISLLTRGTYSCALGSFLKMAGYVFSLASIVTIGFFTIEMYFLILQPFKRERLPRTYLILLSISFFFLLGVTVVTIYVMPMEMWALFQAVSTLTFLLVFFILAVTQYKICKEVARINKNKHTTQTLDNKDAKSRANTNKIALLILFFFGACHTPFVIYAVYAFISNPPTPLSYTYFMMWFYVCIEFSILLDPLIFCLRMKSVRRQIYHLAKCANGPVDADDLTSFRLRRLTTKVGPISTM